MHTNVADIITLISLIYLLIGWISSVMLVILYICKKRYEGCDVPIMYMFIWPKLYTTLFKLIIQEIKMHKASK